MNTITHFPSLIMNKVGISKQRVLVLRQKHNCGGCIVVLPHLVSVEDYFVLIGSTAVNGCNNR